MICIDLNVSYTPGKYQDGNQGKALNIGVLGCYTLYRNNLLFVYRLLRTTKHVGVIANLYCFQMYLILWSHTFCLPLCHANFLELYLVKNSTLFALSRFSNLISEFA